MTVATPKMNGNTLLRRVECLQRGKLLMFGLHLRMQPFIWPCSPPVLLEFLFLYFFVLDLPQTWYMTVARPKMKENILWVGSECLQRGEMVMFGLS